MIKLIQINKKIFTSIYIANNINYKSILYLNQLLLKNRGVIKLPII